MIKNLSNGKIIYKFGKGDIRITGFYKNQIVYLGLKNQNKQREIGSTEKTNYNAAEEVTDDCDGFIGFDNIESLNVVIEELEGLRKYFKLKEENNVN